MNVTDMQTTIRGVVFNQFGHSVAAVQMPLSMLQSLFKIDPEVQRVIDPKRRAEIRDFIILSLEKNVPFYFSPLIFSGRGKLRAEGDILHIEPGNYLYILDGMHRITSMLSAISQLQSEADIAEEINKQNDAQKLREFVEVLLNYPVAMHVFLDLTIEQEKLAFTDINNERKEIQSDQLMQYDQRDEYSRLTTRVANKLQQHMVIEMASTRLTENTHAVTNLTIMKRCFIALFEGIITQKNGQPYYRNCNPKDVPKIAESFFAELFKAFPKEMYDRKKYVIGLSGIQITLAYLTFYLVRELRITHLEAIQHIHHLKKHCTFQHDDPLFRFLYDSSKKQLKNHSTTTAIKRLMLTFLEILHKERGES
ncbi:hypothetical protein LZ480_02060 [Solibacillus sp. MA9]|uniref:DGQHR domain-containing protein n=1 Tax=Solibacillus palustris TaxID=2908203 RepID=A0ABS9U8K7_9BACL|nr:DNA sulfur modification protein DndB [Solibacillus sp. MA9]MCH7320659.1 hypothetical protein [Solibacillus sp. MA9]